jgi:hypothetical protein
MEQSIQVLSEDNGEINAESHVRQWIPDLHELEKALQEGTDLSWGEEVRPSPEVVLEILRHEKFGEYMSIKAMRDRAVRQGNWELAFDISIGDLWRVRKEIGKDVPLLSPDLNAATRYAQEAEMVFGEELD